MLQLTNALINDLAVAKNNLSIARSDTDIANRRASEFEKQIREFKRVHPITIVVFALLQLWGCFLGGATLEWKLAYLREWHFGGFTTAFSAMFALALIVWACTHSESRWYR